MVISTLFKIGMVKLLKNFHTALIVKKQIFQTKILNGINFFLIIIYILIQFKMKSSMSTVNALAISSMLLMSRTNVSNVTSKGCPSTVGGSSRFEAFPALKVCSIIPRISLSDIWAFIDDKIKNYSAKVTIHQAISQMGFNLFEK